MLRICCLVMLLSAASAGVVEDAEAVLQVGKFDSSPSLLQLPRATSSTEASHGSRIAIVGAGPSGIHMASRLKLLGYENVTLLEKTDRVGGKSFTLYRDHRTHLPCTQKQVGGEVDTANCVAIDMGTCYLHSGYLHARHLLQEYGLKEDVVARGDWGVDSGQGGISSASEYLLGAGMQMLQQGLVAVPALGISPGIPGKISAFLTVQHLVLDAVVRYNSLYDKLFGNVSFTMPHRPSREALARMNVTFKEFLLQNNFAMLLPFAALVQTSQGYGRVESIPAYYGLVWMKPELLGSLAAQLMPREQFLPLMNPTFAQQIRDNAAEALSRTAPDISVANHKGTDNLATTMPPEGWGKLWQRMHEQDKLDVRYNVTIHNNGILRYKVGPDPIKITYTQNDDTVTQAFDILMYTAPHALAAEYVSLTTQEQDIFQHLDNFVLMTALYEGDPVPGYSDADNKPGIYRIQALAEDGGWYSDRHDVAVKSGQDVEPQLRWGIQLYESPCDHSPELCNAKGHFPMSEERFKQWQVPGELQKIGEGVINAEQFPWPYFWHFSQEAIQAGKLWDLFDLQGTQNTYWIGASAVFESVHDVINYNLQILDLHFGGNFKGDRELLFTPES